MPENFAIGEIARQRAWNGTAVTLYQFRSATTEVGLVLEQPDGKLAGVEIKAASSVNESDFNGLRALAVRAGKKFHRGVVLHTGARTVAFGKQLHAMPINAVWRL